MNKKYLIIIFIFLFSINVFGNNNDSQFFSLEFINKSFNLDYKFLPTQNIIILEKDNYSKLKIDLDLNIVYSEFKIYKTPKKCFTIKNNKVFIHNHVIYRFYNSFFIPIENKNFFETWYKNYNKMDSGNIKNEKIEDNSGDKQESESNSSETKESDQSDQSEDNKESTDTETDEFIYETTGDENNEDDNYYNKAVKEIVDYRKFTYIVLDPGHGGKDPGAVRGNYYEKTINLSIVKYVKSILKNEFPNLNIIITRNDDTFISLENRVVISNKYNTKTETGIFISFHANASPFSKKTSGFEIYYPDYNLADEKMKNLVQKENLGTNDDDINLYINRLLNEELIYESELLAKYIFDYYKTSNSPIPYRKILGAPFYVLAYNQLPSILLEMGYMTNKNDFKNLYSEQYKKELTYSIIKGVRKYINEYNKTKGFKEF